MIDSVGSCEICFNDYDSTKHIPRIIPTCGHTYCDVCIQVYLNSNNRIFKCPKDQIINNNSNIESYPKNYDFAKLLEKNKLRSSDRCSIHNKRLKLYDADTKELLCSDCTYDGVHSKHEILNETIFRTKVEDKVATFGDWAQRLEEPRPAIQKMIEEKKIVLRNEINTFFEQVKSTLENKKNQMFQVIDDSLNKLGHQATLKWGEAGEKSGVDLTKLVTWLVE